MFRKQSGMVEQRPGYVEISDSHIERFRRFDKAALEETVDLVNAAKARVDDGRLSRKRLEQLEQMCGFKAPEPTTCVHYLAKTQKLPKLVRRKSVCLFLNSGFIRMT